VKRSSAVVTLRPLEAPRRETFTLSNGVTVHVVKRGALPLVSLRLLIQEGGAHDPISVPGLTDFTVRLLRRGAAGQSADQIADAVDFVGASLGAWASEDTVGVALQTPSRHLDSQLELLAAVATQPDFPDAEVELARRRTLAQLSNELDDPGSLAERALQRAVWGEHPYGLDLTGTQRSLETLGRPALVERHRALFTPARASLYVVGDVEPAKVVARLEAALGSWKRPTSELTPLPRFSRATRAGQVTIVDKPEQSQVQVRLGASGIQRGHEDQIPLGVANTALGGGFTSRLMREIRVKRGLSYGAGCHFETLRAAGAFAFSSFTKTESTRELVDIARAQIAGMKAKGPTPAELATVQRYLAGLYPTRLETNDAISGAIADVDTYRLPADWIEKYRDRVMAVTRERAAAVAARHLPEPDALTLVLVGNAKAIAPQVKDLGPVQVVSPKDLG